MRVWFFVLLEMYTPNCGYAYPNGTVAAVCDSMTPHHPSFDPRNTPAPYKVTVDHRAYRPGDVIRVTLESVNGTEFTGFMLQARTISGHSAMGYFMPGNASLVRLHNCFNTEVVYSATFVTNYAEFWTMVSSDSILLSNSPAPAVNLLMLPFCIMTTLTALYSNL